MIFAKSPRSLLSQNSTTHSCGDATKISVLRKASASKAALDDSYFDGLLQECEAISLNDIFSGIFATVISPHLLQNRSGPQVVGAETKLPPSPSPKLYSDLLFDPPPCHRSARAEQDKIRKVR
jgi:hypothetical protein